MPFHPLPLSLFNSPLPPLTEESSSYYWRPGAVLPRHCNCQLSLSAFNSHFFSFPRLDSTLWCCWWCRHRCPRHIVGVGVGDIMRNAMQCCYSFTRQRPLSCLFTFNVVHNSITESSFHSFHSHLHRPISPRVAVVLLLERCKVRPMQWWRRRIRRCNSRDRRNVRFAEWPACNNLYVVYRSATATTKERPWKEIPLECVHRCTHTMLHWTLVRRDRSNSHHNVYDQIFDRDRSRKHFV